jgi:hypothetical protein
VDVEGMDAKLGLLPHQAIDVRIGHHEARGAAVRVPEDPLQVILDADARNPNPAAEGPCGSLLRARWRWRWRW